MTAAWCARLSVSVSMGSALQAMMTFQEGGQKEYFSFRLKITRSRLTLVAKWTLPFW